MNHTFKSIALSVALCLLGGFTAACGEDKSPSVLPLADTVSAAGAITPTLGAANTVSQATVDALFVEFTAFEQDLAGSGATLSTTFASCKEKPTTDEQLSCATTVFSTARIAGKVFIDLNPQLQAKVMDLQKQLDEANKALKEAQARGSSGSSSGNSNTGNSANNGSLSSEQPDGPNSPWLCVMAGRKGVQWDPEKQDYYVNFDGKRWYSMDGVLYLYRKSDGKVLNINTKCHKCHDNGIYDWAICAFEGGDNGGNGNGGQNNGSGNSNANADARARADAEARAKAEVKVDVKVQVEMLLTIYGINMSNPSGSCMCTMQYEPVCVRLPDGRVITFSNSCMAACAGFSSFVSCTTQQPSPTPHNDPFCAMHPHDPSCATPAPTPTCTPTTKPGDPTATRPPMTGTPPPTTGPSATPSCPVEMIRENKFDTVQNMDWGDPFNWVIVQFWDGADANTTVQAVIAPGYNLDVEAKRLVGMAWIMKGTQDAILCRAAQMAREHGGIKLQLWVGPDPVPAGYEKPNNQLGYTMSVWKYGSGGIIETPGTSWASEQISLGKDTLCNNSTGFTYLQLWAPPNAKEVFHIVLENGACVQPPKDVEGSAHHASGGVRLAVTGRINQMMDEVQNRDTPDTMHRVLVGCNPVPSGWSTTLPTGWKVTNTATCR